MSIPSLESTLKQLRLSGLAGTLSLRLQEAAANRLSHEEFLENLLQDEINVRQERWLSRRTKAADFHRLRTLEDFDWRFNPNIPRKQIYDLAAGQFIRQATDVLFIGPPGVGKTHLAQALGYEAIRLNFQVLYRSIFDLVRDFLKDEAFNQQDRVLRRYLKPDLLIIDDMGLKALPKHSGEYLLEVVMRRYENRSTIMTSNRPIQDWGKRTMGILPRRSINTSISSTCTLVLDGALVRRGLIAPRSSAFAQSTRFPESVAGSSESPVPGSCNCLMAGPRGSCILSLASGTQFPSD